MTRVSNRKTDAAIKSAIYASVVLGLALSCVAGAELRPAPDKPNARTFRYESVPGGFVRIKGTSQLHDWEVRGSTISGFMNVGDSFPAQLLQPVFPEKVVARADVSIPVSSLNSDGSMFDPRTDAIIMPEALKSRQHPEIHYRLNELLVPRGTTTNGVTGIFNSDGELVIAGVTNRIAIPISIAPAGENTLKLSGRTEVKMTDFGITPPGFKGKNFDLTVGDEVEITFEWILVRATRR